MGGESADGGRRFGVLVNPRGYPWVEEGVHWSHHDRLKELRERWYGKAYVGDGADAVERSELDPWQKFAHDIVLDERHSERAPCRLMILGSAGTGKSRTVRAFVGSKRRAVRESLDGMMARARVARDAATGGARCGDGGRRSAAAA